MTGFGTAILCGRLSRRMGEDKASLNWKGMPLARYKWEQFAGGSEEVFFSVRDEDGKGPVQPVLPVHLQLFAVADFPVILIYQNNHFIHGLLFSPRYAGSACMAIRSADELFRLQKNLLYITIA